jgi:hypothetical protein
LLFVVALKFCIESCLPKWHLHIPFAAPTLSGSSFSILPQGILQGKSNSKSKIYIDQPGINLRMCSRGCQVATTHHGAVPDAQTSLSMYLPFWNMKWSLSTANLNSLQYVHLWINIKIKTIMPSVAFIGAL